MSWLIAGLIVFLGVHSVHMLAPRWREANIEKIGLLPWKGLYSLVALAGLVLIVIGYGQARLEPTWLWISPVWTRHLAALLVLLAFILLAATYVPGNHIKARLGHPMLLAVKVWALAHLLSNGSLADLLLFGGFLAWAIPSYAVARRRDRAAGTTYPTVGAGRDALAVIVGLVAWALFAFWLHGALFGVRPFG